MNDIKKAGTPYAAANTKNVIEALREYKRTLIAGDSRSALNAAIDLYFQKTGKRVSERTLFRWLAFSSRNGGVDRLPLDAFGGSKSRAHVTATHSERARAIQRECDTLMTVFKLVGRNEIFDLDALANIDRRLRDLLHRRLGNHPSMFLSSIKESALKIENLKKASNPIRLTNTESKTTLAELLSQLTTAIKGPALPAALKPSIPNKNP